MGDTWTQTSNKVTYEILAMTLEQTGINGKGVYNSDYFTHLNLKFGLTNYVIARILKSVRKMKWIDVQPDNGSNRLWIDANSFEAPWIITQTGIDALGDMQRLAEQARQEEKIKAERASRLKRAEKELKELKELK